MLQVRDLAVEVGGRYTLTGATFTLRAGDKVGLVGRNGVGKTSLLKVLAGDAPAAEGFVARSGAVGHLSQEPPPRGKGIDETALSHVLSARGLDVAAHLIMPATTLGLFFTLLALVYGGAELAAL